MIKFIEIEESKRGPLRFGSSGNPNRELFGVELRQLVGSIGREFFLSHLDVLGLNSFIANGQATPAGFAEKPQAIGRRLAVSGPARGFANGRPKRLLSLAHIAGHKETEAVELREILIMRGHAQFLEAGILAVSHRTDKFRCDKSRLSIEGLQPPRDFVGVSPAVKS